MKDKYLFISSLIFFAVFILFLVMVFSPLNKIFSPFVTAVVLVYILSPAVNCMKKWKIHSVIATSLLYGICILAVTFLMVFVAPKISLAINEIMSLLQNLFGGLDYFSLGRNILTERATEVYSTIVLVVKMCINGFVGIVAAFYVLADMKNVKESLAEIVPEKLKPSFKILADDVKYSLDSFFKGQLLIGAILFLLDGVFLWAVGVPYAWGLSLIAGIFDIVPYAGAFVAMGLISLVTFFCVPEKILIVIPGLLIIQQIENNIITPKVSSKTLYLHPSVTVFALYVGSFGGFWGVLLAVPLVCIFKKICERFIQSLL